MNQDEYRNQVFHEKLEPHLDRWTGRLKLSHWAIACEVGHTVGDDVDTLALVKVNKDLGHKAQITFRDDAAFADDVENERTCIHELLHVHLDELAQYAERHMDDGDVAWFRRLVEQFTADMTGVLYSLAHEVDDGRTA